MKTIPNPNATHKINTEMDYIHADKHRFSLKFFVSNYKKTVNKKSSKSMVISMKINTFEGIGNHRISYLLLLTPQEVESIYQAIMEKARQSLKINI